MSHNQRDLNDMTISPTYEKKIKNFRRCVWIDSAKIPMGMPLGFELTIPVEHQKFRKTVGLSNIYIELPMGYSEPYYYIKLSCTEAKNDVTFVISHGDLSTDRMYPVYVDDKETPLSVPVFFRDSTMINIEFYDTDFNKIMVGRFCGIAKIRTDDLYDS